MSQTMDLLNEMLSAFRESRDYYFRYERGGHNFLPYEKAALETLEQDFGVSVTHVGWIDDSLGGSRPFIRFRAVEPTPTSTRSTMLPLRKTTFDLLRSFFASLQGVEPETIEAISEGYRTTLIGTDGLFMEVVVVPFTEHLIRVSVGLTDHDATRERFFSRSETCGSVYNDDEGIKALLPELKRRVSSMQAKELARRLGL